MKWWHLRPILPPSALDDPAGLREVKEWMDRAADEVDRLREALATVAKMNEIEAGFLNTKEAIHYARFIARAALGEEKPLEDRWDNA